MNERIAKIKALGNNHATKADFIKCLNKSKPSLGVHTIDQYWRHAIDALTNEVKNIHPNYRIDWQSAEDMLLQSAEYGLSFDPRSKELYINVDTCTQNESMLQLKLGLKYNGMKNRLVKFCGVRMLTTEVVCQADTFEWRGQWKEPLYIMGNEESDIRLAFGMVKLKTGEVMAYKLSIDELAEIERNDIERATQIYNNPDASFYKGAYRKRMFEIAMLRYMYGQVASILDDELSQPTITDKPETDIADAMEAELNQIQAAG